MKKGLDTKVHELKKMMVDTIIYMLFISKIHKFFSSVSSAHFEGMAKVGKETKVSS